MGIMDGKTVIITGGGKGGGIGRTCVFLCSEDAKYISGETITMQGGSDLRP